ncbi:uncharacterized protein FN964_012144 isoform 2-T2 [Alca torda]
MAAPAAPAAGLHLTPSPTSSEPARAGSGRLYSTHSFPGSGVLSAGAGGGGKKRPGHLPRVDRAAPPDMAAPAAPALPPQRGRGRGGPRRPYKERRAGLPILLLRRGQGLCEDGISWRPDVMAVAGSDDLRDEGSCLVCSTTPEPLPSKNGCCEDSVEALGDLM